jgi:DNA-binding MarR family transcriptional regulator
MRGARSAAFLLAQVGGHAAERFGERLATLHLSRPQAGILRAVAANAGLSQQALAETLSLVPSRLVVLVDELEARGLVERRDHPDDRRVYALHLTAKGDQTMADVGRVARANDEALCAALTAKERGQLVELLARIAEEQGLIPGVHPGLRRPEPSASEPAHAAKPKRKSHRAPR